MKHKINKMATIFIASIFALSGLGVAFAAWTDTITIGGTVDTGNLCLKWRAFTDASGNPLDPYITQQDVGPDWHSDMAGGMVNVWPDPEYKDVGSTTFTWGDTDHKIIVMTVNNAYPCYYNHISTWIKACDDSTIPLKIWKVLYTFTDVATGYQETAEVTSEDVLVTFHDATGAEIFEINWGDNFGGQIHAGGKIDVSFEFHVLQPAEQNHQYTIKIEVVGIQWNEYSSMMNSITV